MRHPHHPLAGRQQRLVQPARDMPAVLNRPDPILVQPTCPPHRGQMPCASLRWLNADEADLRRTTLTQGVSRASIKSRRWSSDGGGRQDLCQSARLTTEQSRVSPPPARGPTGRVGRHRPDDTDPDSESSLAGSSGATVRLPNGTGVRALRLRRAAAAIRSRTGRGRVRCRNRCRREGVPQRNSSPPLLLLADVHNARHPAAPTSAVELAGTTPSSTASPLACARSQSHPRERRPYPGFPYQTSRRPNTGTLNSADRSRLVTIRDRVGAGLIPAPPTPPGVRVRTGRFA